MSTNRWASTAGQSHSSNIHTGQMVTFSRPLDRLTRTEAAWELAAKVLAEELTVRQSVQCLRDNWPT